MLLNFSHWARGDCLMEWPLKTGSTAFESPQKFDVGTGCLWVSAFSHLYQCIRIDRYFQKRTSNISKFSYEGSRFTVCNICTVQILGLLNTNWSWPTSLRFFFLSGTNHEGIGGDVQQVPWTYVLWRRHLLLTQRPTRTYCDPTSITIVYHSVRKMSPFQLHHSDLQVGDLWRVHVSGRSKDSDGR